jgi:hypothetical protein
MRALRLPHRPLLLALVLAAYVGVVAGGALLGHALVDRLVLDIRPSNEPQIHVVIMATTATYMLVSAVPFVPGAEIGLGLIMVLGPGIVPLIYASTVLALTLAYLVGRLVPARALAAGLGALGLRRARALVLEVEGLDAGARLALLTARAPGRLVPLLLRWRYLALALAFNLPGNTLIGGGGGIAMMAGMSGLCPLLPFLATVAVAVAPVPLLVLLGGRIG